MKFKTLILMLVSGLIGSIGAGAARLHPPQKPDELSESEALGLMRTINTSQVVAFSDAKHQYASLDELLDLIQQNGRQQWPLQLRGGSTGRVKNYAVSIVVSGDGQRYVSEMISSSNCGLALFSNESGVIYTAWGLGCAHEKAPAENPN